MAPKAVKKSYEWIFDKLFCCFCDGAESTDLQDEQPHPVNARRPSREAIRRRTSIFLEVDLYAGASTFSDGATEVHAISDLNPPQNSHNQDSAVHLTDPSRASETTDDRSTPQQYQCELRRKPRVSKYSSRSHQLIDNLRRGFSFDSSRPSKESSRQSQDFPLRSKFERTSLNVLSSFLRPDAPPPPPPKLKDSPTPSRHSGKRPRSAFEFEPLGYVTSANQNLGISESKDRLVLVPRSRRSSMSAAGMPATGPSSSRGEKITRIGSQRSERVSDTGGQRSEWSQRILRMRSLKRRWDEETRRRDEEETRRRWDEELRRHNEEMRRLDEETRRLDEESRRLDEKTRMLNEEATRRRWGEETRRRDEDYDAWMSRGYGMYSLSLTLWRVTC
jgi:hypothetical protein